MKVLVVDDEKLLVKGIKFNLENEGYQVDSCHDGETAVQMARENSYDIIILDLMMPRVDGLEACQQMFDDLDFGAVKQWKASCALRARSQ